MMSMGMKFDRVVTFHEEPLHIKSYDPVITWSCEFTQLGTQNQE